MALQDKVSQAWINFARTGNPSQPGLEWKPYTKEDPQAMVFDTVSQSVALRDDKLVSLLAGYAMGATPVSALNLVAYPLATLGPEVLREILRGGAEAVAEAGASIVGGHSIDDPEPKYGLAVTGIVAPAERSDQRGRAPRRPLVLTKPLGAGTIATALKRGLASAPLVARGVEVMTTLNARARRQARAAGAHALTDVTGFGLLGHTHELAFASGCAAEIDAAAVPAIEGVLDLLSDERALAGGSRAQPRRRRDLHDLVGGRPRPAPPPGLRRDDLGRPPRRAPARRGDRRLAGRPPRLRGPPGVLRVTLALGQAGEHEPEHDADDAADDTRRRRWRPSSPAASAPARRRSPARPAGRCRPRSPCGGRARRASSTPPACPSAAPLAPSATPSPATTTATYAPPAPATKNTSSGAHQPCRRSSSQPNSAMVPTVTAS